MLALATLVAVMPQAVTFRSPVEPLRYSIPELGRAMGRSLAVSPSIEWETLYIKVKSARVEDVLKEIAFASFGVWQTAADGSMTLTQDKALIESREVRSKQEWRKQLRQLISPHTNDLPTQAILRSVLSDLGSDNLAVLGKGTRTVFSTKPTHMQRPLMVSPESVQRLVGLRNEALTKQAQQQPREHLVVPPDTATLVTAESLDLIRKLFGNPPPRRVTEEVAKVNVVFDRGQYGVQASIAGYSAEPKRLFFNTLELNPEELEVTPAPDPQVALSVADPLVFSKATEEFLQLMDTGNYEGKAQVSDDRGVASARRKRLRALITTPDRTDPWLTYQTEVMDMSPAKQNVIAHLDGWTFGPDDELPTDAWLRERLLAMDTRSTDAWISYRPREVGRPINRQSFARAVQLTDKARLDFDGIAEMAYLSKQADIYGMQEELWVALIQDGEMFWRVDKEVLSLYWSLGPSLRSSLKGGKSIPFSTLGKEPTSLLQDLAFGSTRTFRSNWESADPGAEFTDYTQDLNEAIKSAYDGRLKVKFDLGEPTEALPDGLPSDGFLRLSTTEGEGYSIVYASAEEAGPDCLSLRDMLSYYVRWETSEGEKPEGYRSYSQRTYELSVLATPTYGVKAIVPELLTNPSPVKSIESLDRDSLALLSKMRQNYKALEKFLGGVFGSGGARTPPPD